MNAPADFHELADKAAPSITSIAGIRNIENPLSAHVSLSVNGGKPQTIPFDQPVSVHIEEKMPFALAFAGRQGVPAQPLPLQLLADGFVIDPQKKDTGWHIAGQTPHRCVIRFGDHNKNLLGKFLVTDGHGDTVKIIIVGTVPTGPGHGGPLQRNEDPGPDGMLDNIQTVELEAEDDVSTVCFTVPDISETILLSLHKTEMLTTAVGPGEVFSISMYAGSKKQYLSVALKITGGSVALAYAQAGWSGNENTFTYSPGNGQDFDHFSATLMFTPSRRSATQEIIIVGTVPTLPTGGEE